MSSILKVDQLQDSGGNSIISSNGSGTFTPGSLNIANAQIASNAAIATTKLGTGAVLQVVHGSTNTQTVTSSTSYVATTLAASITPSSTSSKIAIMFSSTGIWTQATTTSVNLALFRDSTELFVPQVYISYVTASTDNQNCVSGSWLDTPSSASAISYNLQFKRQSGSTNVSIQQNNSRSTITLMEIAG